MFGVFRIVAISNFNGTYLWGDSELNIYLSLSSHFLHFHREEKRKKYWAGKRRAQRLWMMIFFGSFNCTKYERNKWNHHGSLIFFFNFIWLVFVTFCALYSNGVTVQRLLYIKMSHAKKKYTKKATFECFANWTVENVALFFIEIVFVCLSNTILISVCFCVNCFNVESHLIDHFRQIIFSLAHFVLWLEPFYLKLIWIVISKIFAKGQRC